MAMRHPWRLLMLALALLAPGAAHAQEATPAMPDDLVNLDHLRFLTQPVEIDGTPMALVHIYSEFPE